ncbi:hypothetical protein ACHQM5_006758 [Ranunculus cassubicifolius]
MEEKSRNTNSPPPNKRQKTSSKGKQKIIINEDEHESQDSSVCGICFEGKAIRGWIDSCDHHFCFVCIMEWSKVESRCPLCKQRFKAITRKPLNGGVFLQERVVNVPVRNQVWHPLGNQTTTENSDPYAEVKCVKCQSSSDDHLLLLCDLCDLAAHTFCAGLGYTVPEGDWYCEDCTVVKNEHSDGENDSDRKYVTNSFRTVEVENYPRDTSYPITTDDSDTDTDYLEANNSVPTANFSISDIIRQSRPRPRISTRSTGRTSRPQNDLSSHQPDRGIVSDSAETDSSARGIISNSAGTDSSARTLGRCRNVRNRIQVLRQNWDAFRNGSLVFSNLFNSDAQNKRRHGREEINDRSSRAQPSSSPNTAKDNASGVKLDKKGRYDVDRAWKMLDIANSVQRPRKCTQSSPHISTPQPGERNVPRAANNTGSTPPMSRSRSFQPGPSQSFDPLSKQACLGDQAPKLVEKGHVGNQSSPHQVGKQDGLKRANNTSLAMSISRSKKSQPEDLRLELETNSRHQCLELEHQKLKSGQRGISLDTLRTSSCSRPPSVHPSLSSELSLAIPAHTLDQDDLFERRKSDENSASLNLTKRRSNTPSASHTESLCRGSKLSQNRLESCASSVLKEKQSKERGTDKSCAKVLLKKDNDAKSEVQSLVKLNLKLLNRDKQLGVDGFKEVARLATHTILAACGFEHKESSVRPFSNTICRHNDQTKHLHMSNLMPSACRECFYGFVKDVVSSIMAEG